MELLPKDVLYRLALEMEYNDIVRLCQCKVEFKEIFKNETFWYNKIRHDYPEMKMSMCELRDWYNKFDLDKQIVFEKDKFKTLILDVLNYLHFSNNLLPLFMGNFEKLDTENVEYYYFENSYIGAKSNNKSEGMFILNLLNFIYKSSGFKPQSVQLTGSFDKWQIRHQLQYDHAKGSWHITLLLPKGRYLYKFIIDGSNWVHSFDDPSERDGSGNINNFIELL